LDAAATVAEPVVHAALLTGGARADAGEGGDSDKRNAPPKSFFSKYWMYIVPMGLIALNTIINVPSLLSPLAHSILC
jgi:hypothetical protein